jgi:hypothetical protein
VTKATWLPLGCPWVCPSGAFWLEVTLWNVTRSDLRSRHPFGVPLGARMPNWKLGLPTHFSVVLTVTRRGFPRVRACATWSWGSRLFFGCFSFYHFFFIFSFFFIFFYISLVLSDIFFIQHFQQVIAQNSVQWSSLQQYFLRAWWRLSCYVLHIDECGKKCNPRSIIVVLALSLVIYPFPAISFS